MAEWDPGQYLRFEGERLRPALDLLARVPLERPARIVDLGCGAGNVSAILKQRFPDADVLGVDGSAAMLEKARAAAPGCRFVEADATAWRPDEPLDLIYSNAALHWLPDHAALFPRLLSLLAPGGCLAVQMPAMHDAPFRALQYTVAARGPWAERLRGVGSAPPILDAGGYWDLLRPRATTLELWETTYLHALHGEEAVVEWATGSSLRPFLDALPEGDRLAFRRAYADAVRPHYPRRADGTTLLPFRRLFLLAGV
ncbi:MAG: methyltransferase domain-containing protein [Alphaproteobacteria bacterium]|nr:methyltransferase domain-containing protein [Alphaproteobacteria bacterium]